MSKKILIPTVAVMSRIQLIEAPYLNEYINWYKELGFNKIYFLNTEPENINKIKEFISLELLKNVVFINHTCPTNTFSYLRNAFNTIIKEDYVLHADSDEYFMLPKTYTNISNFVSKNKYDKYYFRWVNIPIDALFQSNMAEYLNSMKATGRYCPTYKMMVNRKTWLRDRTAICDPHDFKCVGSSKIFQDPIGNGTIPFYIHFLLRGYLHTVLKVLEQRLPTIRGKTPKSQLIEFLKNQQHFNQYPFRILSGCGEYALCTLGYLSKKGNWKVPLYVDINKESTYEKTNNLYKQILLKYKIKCITQDILVNDEFNLENKIKQCILICNKYIKELQNKTPDFIGRYISQIVGKKLP